MKRKTLHDEKYNEDYYYESDNHGKTWHEVEPEDIEESEEEDEGEDS